MKKLIILTIFLTSGICYGQCPKDDTTVIRQEIFPSLGKFALVTNMGSMYDNVIWGNLEFILSQKEIEIQNALRRKKPTATVKIICD